MFLLQIAPLSGRSFQLDFLRLLQPLLHPDRGNRQPTRRFGHNLPGEDKCPVMRRMRPTTLYRTAAAFSRWLQNIGADDQCIKMRAPYFYNTAISDTWTVALLLHNGNSCIICGTWYACGWPFSAYRMRLLHVGQNSWNDRDFKRPAAEPWMPKMTLETMMLFLQLRRSFESLAWSPLAISHSKFSQDNYSNGREQQSIFSALR